MKFEAMMKIRIDGTSARVRKARTSFTLKRGADALLAVLEAELDEVAEEEDEQQQEDDDVEVEQGEDDQVRRHRQLGRAQRELEREASTSTTRMALMIRRLRFRLPWSRVGSAKGLTGSGSG